MNMALPYDATNSLPWSNFSYHQNRITPAVNNVSSGKFSPLA
jgi:hypothetical protein